MHLYTLLLNLEKLRVKRDIILNALTQENIGTGVHYIALHLHPYYAETYRLRDGDFPNAEWISARTISLPLSPRLNDEDVDNVIEATIKVLRYFSK